MAFGGGMLRGQLGTALLARVVAGLLTLAGCGSGGGERLVGGGARPLTGSALPAWAAALGPGVSVYAPASVPAGHGSPGGVVTAFIRDIEKFETGQLTAAAVCQYWPPSQQARCESAAGTAPASTGAAPSAPAIGNFAIGYAAIMGTRAIVGYTGTSCSGTPPQCSGNSDPAAFFSSGKPFGILWEELVGGYGSSYRPVECIEVGGSWYLNI